MSGNIDTLLADVAICEDYRPPASDADVWRRAFDNLSAERGRVERQLIRNDRSRMALMAADAVILAANAPNEFLRNQLLGISFRMRTLACQDLFDDGGMFRKAGEA